MTTDPLFPALLLLPAGVALLPIVHLAYATWVRRRFPRVGHVLVHEGTRLHFTSAGSGPVVVLVHGANGIWRDFPAELISDLAADHTVLTLDRPGHGWSDAREGPLGLRENASALAALLRMHGAQGATLVGHSYGAAVALRTALDAPELVSHVVAVTPCTVIDARNSRYANCPLVGEPAGLALFHFIALPLMPLGLPMRAQAYYPDRPPRGWSASRLFAHVPSQIHATSRNFRTLHADMGWLAEHLPRLSARLTVLAGADDRVTPPARHVEWLRRALPSARIEVLPRIGHWLLRLRPDLVAGAVRRIESAQPVGPAGR